MEARLVGKPRGADATLGNARKPKRMRNFRHPFKRLVQVAGALTSGLSKRDQVRERSRSGPYPGPG